MEEWQYTEFNLIAAYLRDVLAVDISTHVRDWFDSHDDSDVFAFASAVNRRVLSDDKVIKKLRADLNDVTTERDAMALALARTVTVR